MDPYRRCSDQTRQPRIDVVHGDSRDILQARRTAPSSQGTFQFPTGHPRMQQTQANSQAYFTQDHQGTPSHQYAQGYSYAPSTQLAHQGSAGPQQYDDSFNAHHRVNLSGEEYSWDDPPRRTASYVRSGQQYNTGARYAQHVEDPERYGVKDAVGIITRFDSQFSGSTSTYARPQNPQRGVSPWPYPQRIDSGYRDYPQTSEYPSHDGKSSRRRQ